MVLENVKEMWTETPRLASGKKGRPINKDRFISKMYVESCSFQEDIHPERKSSMNTDQLLIARLLRGDSVILVLLS